MKKELVSSFEVAEKSLKETEKELESETKRANYLDQELNTQTTDLQQQIKRLEAQLKVSQEAQSMLARARNAYNVVITDSSTISPSELYGSKVLEKLKEISDPLVLMEQKYHIQANEVGFLRREVARHVRAGNATERWKKQHPNIRHCIEELERENSTMCQHIRLLQNHIIASGAELPNRPRRPRSRSAKPRPPRFSKKAARAKYNP